MASKMKYQKLQKDAPGPKRKGAVEEPVKKFSLQSFLKWMFVGYMTGLVATIIWFTLFKDILIYLRNQSTRKTLYFLLFYGCILAFSRNARCISALILPILFSSKGRSAVMAVALVLTATGPTTNILNNIDVLVESISCGQQQLKEALEKMLDVIKRPLLAIKNAIGMAMDQIKEVLEKLQVVLVRIQKLIFAILGAIKAAFDWLSDVVSVCNKKIGTPFDRCIRLADTAIEDCKEKMGAMKGLCNVTDLFRGLCYSVKFIDHICVLVGFVSDSIIGTVAEKLEKFTQEIKAVFFVSVKFEHDFNFKTVATKNMSDVGSDIVADIQKELKGIFYLFGWLEFIGGFMSFFLIYKAMLYKRKYFVSDRFDNHFITRDFITIDKQRTKMGKKSVLPLTRKERGRYVKITSTRLVRPEVRKMSRTILFLTVPTVQILCICLTDYGLYWLLDTINRYGHKEAGLEVPPFFTVRVTGYGLAAEIFKGIVRAFGPLTQKYIFDPRPCLPIPLLPTYDKYWEIGALVALAWVFLFCQPYGLRCRQVVMGAYYPRRSKERALWLYDQILWHRETFLKFARRQARSKILKDQSAEAYSFSTWIRVKLSRRRFFQKVIKLELPKACTLCASPLIGEDKMVKCQTVGCKGMYCTDCFAELNNMCCLCANPIDYGDMSDISEEKDSSDELEGVEVS